MISGGAKNTEIFDYFPFWSDEEIKEHKLAKYRAYFNNSNTKEEDVKDGNSSK